jgi:hypothetical protein
MFFVMIYVYSLLPLVYAIFQRRCCRNFIYECQMCSSVAFQGVCGPWGVTSFAKVLATILIFRLSHIRHRAKILSIDTSHSLYSFAIFSSKEEKDGYIEPEGDESTSMVWLSKALVIARIIYFNCRWETHSPSVGLGPLSFFVWVFGPIIVSTK